MVPISATKVLVLIEKKRESLMVKNNSGEKTFDDNVSHNSKISTYSKQPIHVADRFLKQVMMIGKLGGIQFQAADLSEETKTP